MAVSHQNLALFIAMACAAPVQAAQAADHAAPYSTGGLLQMLVGLGLVLGLVMAMGWVMKRLAGRGLAGGSTLRVVAAAAIGQRERVAVIEIGDTWLVVGVAPGCVSALHSMQRGELQPPAAPGPGGTRLPDWLQKTLERSHAR